MDSTSRLKMSNTNQWLVMSDQLSADGLDAIAKLSKLKQVCEERYKKDTKPRVLVIGFGASGFGAATKLEKAGYSVVVVDAQERFGGRVRSTPFSGTVIDEGASFIHGTHGNPIADMFSAAMTYSPDPDGYSMYDEQGRAVEPGVDKSVQQEFNQMLDMLDWLRERNGVQAADPNDERTKRRRGGHLKRQVVPEESEARTGPASPPSEKKRALKRKTFSEIPDTTNWSLEQGIKYYLDSTHKSSSVLRQLYTAVLQDRPRTNGAARNNKMTGSEDLRRQVFMWHVANIEAPCSSPVANLSLHHWDQDDPHEFGGDHVMPISGYNQFFKLKSVSHVLYNVAISSVTCLEDEDSDCVKVTYEFTAAVDADEQQRVAQVLRPAFDLVIVTASLGVLKRNLITFDPPLTEHKVKSIKRLGFGVFNKLFIAFESPFWTKDLAKDYIMLVSPSQGLYYIVVNLYKMKKVPVLMAFIAGRAAVETEKLSDEAAVLSLCSHLAKIYGPVSAIKEYKLTRWSTKPWIFGSYTYVSVEASGEDYDVLAEPHENIVLFAGEHTNREHPATVAGAYMSGMREADRVMEYTKKGYARQGKRTVRDILLCEARAHFRALLQDDTQFEAQFQLYLDNKADDDFTQMMHDIGFKIENDQLYMCAAKQGASLSDIRQHVNEQKERHAGHVTNHPSLLSRHVTNHLPLRFKASHQDNHAHKHESDHVDKNVKMLRLSPVPHKPRGLNFRKANPVTVNNNASKPEETKHVDRLHEGTHEDKQAHKHESDHVVNNNGNNSLRKCLFPKETQDAHQWTANKRRKTDVPPRRLLVKQEIERVPIRAPNEPRPSTEPPVKRERVNIIAYVPQDPPPKRL